MSYSTKSIKISSLTISNDGNNMLLESTDKLALTGKLANPILMPNENLVMAGNTINNLTGITSTTATELIIEGKGNTVDKGGVILNHSTSGTTEFEVKNNGQVYFNDLPNVSATTNPSTDNQFITMRSFISSAGVTYSPTLYGFNPSGTNTTVSAYTTQRGWSTRAGNLVFFQAQIQISGTFNNYLADNQVRVTLPISIPNTTTLVAYTQALCVNNSTGYKETTPPTTPITISDISMSINGFGNIAPPSNVNYAIVYKRPDQLADDQETLKMSDIAAGYQICYGGFYYIFP